MEKKIKVVILCGGMGTRLREETEYRPKPMIEIGGKPILWHIMKIYAHYGFKEFVLCLGYKGEMIKEYFLNYEMMNNDFIGICGCKILYKTDIGDIIQDIGLICDAFGFPIGNYSGTHDVNQRESIKEVFFNNGCCLAIKKELIDKIGCFDPKYFIFAEDLDLCWRAHLVGYKVVANSIATLYHEGGGSDISGIYTSKKYKTSINRIYLRERNTIRTLIKNYSTRNIVKIVPAYLLINLGEIIFFSFLLKFSVSYQYIRAYWWNLINLKDTFKERKKIQNARKVNDKEIMKLMRKGIGKLKAFKKRGIPIFVK